IKKPNSSIINGYLSNILDFIRLSSINPLSLHHINKLTTKNMNYIKQLQQENEALKVQILEAQELTNNI
ncbi:hypothetical protein U2075_14925, partial [Listeria monocytogenes]|uniref:hypothetical protein n=1 Tax=Listeria monocytogenes TaxID=1639 RepID=UPI002FDC4425